MRKKIKYIWKLLLSDSFYLAVKKRDGKISRLSVGLNVGDAKVIVDDLVDTSSSAIEMENALNDAKNIISGIG